MSDTFKVVTVTEYEKAELLEQPLPEEPLGPDEMCGKTLASLVSPGTELNTNYLGKWFPQTPGYAAVFEVEEVGEEITEIKPGDVVLTSGPAGMGGHRSFQRCNRQSAVPVPQNVAPVPATLARLMCVSMTTLTTTVARPPEKVLVMGLGPVGHLACQTYFACGYEVMAVDPDENRRKLLADKGFERVFEKTPLEDKETLANVALVLECSGNEQATLEGCKAVRKRGEVVQIGIPWKARTEILAQELLHAVYRGYVTLRSGWEWEISRYGEPFRVGSVFGNIAGAMRFLSEGRIDTEGLYEVVSPADPQKVYQDLLHKRIDALSVVFDWSKV
ncbi:MAG: zinc-binding dehydrogenase [Phycisphaerae bacterium]